MRIGDRAERTSEEGPSLPAEIYTDCFYPRRSGDPGSFWDQNRLLPSIVIQAALGFSAGVPKVGGKAARPGANPGLRQQSCPWKL